MTNRFFKKVYFPLILLLVCLFAYGILSPFLGFYWDDLPYMWFKHTAGPIGAIRAIAMDRPVLGLFYFLPMSLLPETPLPWQIFAILCRWVFALATFSFLSTLFPKHRTANQLLTLLFLVFPGFTQQYISVIYSHVFLIFALYFCSLVLFIQSLGKGKFIWLGLLSIIIAVVCMAAVEYLVGLEVLRPFIIFLVLSRERSEQNFRQKIRETLKLWWPYLLAGLGFVFYRIFLASSVLYKVSQVDKLTQSPLATIFHLIIVILHNIYEALVSAWIQIIQPLTHLDFHSAASLLYLAILVFTFFVSAAGVFFILKRKDLDTGKEYLLSLLTGGMLVNIFAGLPFWAANFQLETNFPADRFFLPFMLASSAVIFLPLLLLKKNKIIFSILFAMVFSLSLSFQIYQANNYRNEWDRFENFISQVTLRIPSLEENTLLVTDDLPSLKYYSDNSLTAAFNWIYADPHQRVALPYLINFTKARLGFSLPSLSPGTAVVHNYRTYQFQGSTNQMIVFYHLPPGCFHIADPDLDPYNPLIDASIRPTAALSRPDLIRNQTDQNQVFFNKENEPDSWCFYYQNASLAAQNGDWQTVVKLGETAFNLNDYPNDASERIPYIEAYAMTGDWQRAYDLTAQTYQVSKLYQSMMCRLWKRIDMNTEQSAEKEKGLTNINDLMDCGI